MSGEDEAIRRAFSALRAGEPAVPDDHPGHEMLEAYVEGRLSAEARAQVEALAAASPIVAEDLADLRAIHESLTATPVGRRNVHWGRTAAIVAAIAASIVAAVWVSNRPQSAPSPAPAAAASRLTPGEAVVVRSATESGHISLGAQAIALRSREGTLLGDSSGAAFRLQSPVGTAVSGMRPSFTWDDTAADAYTVAVFDDSFSQVASGRVTGNTWTANVDLARGKTYSWQVTAHRGTTDVTEPRPPRAEARFTVIDAATANRVAEMRQRLDANDPLPLGVLLAQEGLIDDAREALTRASHVPATADLAARLLASLDHGTPITTKPAQ